MFMTGVLCTVYGAQVYLYFQVILYFMTQPASTLKQDKYVETMAPCWLK